MRTHENRRVLIKVIAVAFVLAASVAVPTSASATPTNTQPTAMLGPSNSNTGACPMQSTSITQACINAAVSDWNNALAKEGKGPISAASFGSDFASLSVASQLLRLTNLDRSLHGYSAIGGIDGTNHAEVQAAVNNSSDASGPSCYCSWGSNYASTLNTLVTEFLWMYDDGPNSPNKAGDWAHRTNILTNYGSPQYMDVATNSGTGTTTLYWGYPAGSGGGTSGGGTGGGASGGSTGGTSSGTTVHRPSTPTPTPTVAPKRHKPYLHYRR